MPESSVALEQLEEELAPMRLPVAVRRFWERVDAATLRAVTYPRLHGPDFALTCYRMARDEFAATQPPALVQIAYTSHQCMSAELAHGEIAGGALFEWNVVDGGFQRRFNSLGEWIAHTAELIDAGRYRRLDTDHGAVLHVPDPQAWHDEERRRPTPAPHPVYGTSTTIGRDLSDWPEHWRLAAGVTDKTVRPRGATHTVAEVLRSPTERGLEATIAARVLHLAGGQSVRVRVADSTGRIDVLCPAAVALLAPPRVGDWFEFDIEVPPGPRIHPPDDPVARPGDDPVGAVATAVRRLRPR